MKLSMRVIGAIVIGLAVVIASSSARDGVRGITFGTSAAFARDDNAAYEAEQARQRAEDAEQQERYQQEQQEQQQENARQQNEYQREQEEQRHQEEVDGLNSQRKE